MRMFGMLVMATIFIIMLGITETAAKRMSLAEGWRSYLANPRAAATLYDAYSGFIIYWMWSSYRRRNNAAHTLWRILIMAPANISTSAYLLCQLNQSRLGAPTQNALIKRGV